MSRKIGAGVRPQAQGGVQQRVQAIEPTTDGQPAEPIVQIEIAPPLASAKPVCFVIMPSGNHKEYAHGAAEADFIYQTIIEPAVRRAFDKNVTVVRESDNRAPGSITRNIVSKTATCDIAIVDITGQNPNVFFELGIRYSLRKKTTILLRQSGVAIPFDIQQYRCVDYSPFEQAEAIENIVATIDAAQKSTSGSDSLVYEVFSQLSVQGIPGVEPEEESGEAGQMPWMEYWRRTQRISAILTDDRLRRRYAPSIIVGISNGGMIFADLLARQLGGYVPVVGLWADRMRRSKDYFDSEINRQLLVGIESIGKNSSPNANGEMSPDDDIEMLLVDDIVASGTTVQQAIDFIKTHLPIARISFLPMFNRNVQYTDAIKNVLLWQRDPFTGDPRTHEVSGTNWTKLPYLKDIRSA